MITVTFTLQQGALLFQLSCCLIIIVIVIIVIIFTALHAMQTRSSDENSVRPSVRHTRVL